MTDTNQPPPHTITINDHPEPHIMQWSDLELAAIKKYAESYALQALAQVQGEPFAWVEHHKGGDNLVWDEPGGRKSPLYTTPQPSQATQADVTDERLLEIGREWTKEVGWYEFEVNDFIGCARAILALRPVAVPMTDEQRNDLICTVTTLGAKLSRRDLVGTAIDWTEAHHGISAQAKKETT